MNAHAPESKPPTPAMLLFDVDATMLKTAGAGMRAMQRVGRELFGADFSWQGVNAAGHLDHLIFAEAATLNGVLEPAGHLSAFRERYLRELPAELDRSVDNLSLMPGFPQIIHKLIERRSSGETLTWGVLTGNFRAAIPIKLRAVGIDPDWFDFHIGSEDGKRREDLVACALAGYELRLGRPADPRRVLVIGDTPRDVACARAHGCFALGVATGRYSQADLLEAGADRAVPDLADPTPLLELL